MYRLSDCELDGERFELRRNGVTVPVEPQVLELVLYLVAHRDRAVTRSELFEKLWRGRIVTDSALNSRIKAARAAIGDDGEAQAQIRTLHRTGYRFVGEVHEVRATDSPPPSDPVVAARPDGSAQPPRAASSAIPVEESAARAAARSARRPFGALGAALGLIVAVGAFSLLPRDAREIGTSAAVASSAAPAPAPAANRKSIAVLPFTNLSDDAEQDYFADGVGVELMKVLSHMPDLLVTGRSSSAYFEGRNETPAAIGRQLGVAHLLTGSVRRNGNDVRIAVELVDAESGYQLWADSYDRELRDIFDVQDEIAERVATALQVKLGLGASSELGMTRNVEAYDEFLRGYAAYNDHTPEAFPRAIEHMHRAIALDPTFSRAWAYLYCIYTDGANVIPLRSDEWARKAQQALEHARSVTPDSPFVQVLLAREAMRYGRTLEARAILDRLPDGYWTADRFVTRDVFLGRFFILVAHAQKAIETLERARAADPLSPVVALYLSQAYALADDSKLALEVGDRGVELGSLQPVIRGNALLIALGTKDGEEISRRIAAAPPNATGQRPVTDGVLPYLNDAAAARAELRRIAAAPAPRDYVGSVVTAYWAAYFGDTELALHELQSIAHGAPDEALLWRPVLTDVRRLAGFKDLVRREGLVDYWRAHGWPHLCRPTDGEDFECS